MRAPLHLRAGLNQKEVAAELGITTRTLQRWALDSFGPTPHPDGASVLYDPADVALFKAGARS